MKVKVFAHDSTPVLEERINKWLAENPYFIDVKFATQSEGQDFITITLFYEETGIKDKGDYMK